MNKRILAKMMQSAPTAFDVVANGIALSGFYSSSTIDVHEPEDAVALVESMPVDALLGPNVRLFCGTIASIAPAVVSKRGIAIRMFAIDGVDDPAIVAGAGTGIGGETLPPWLIDSAQVRQELEGMRRLLQLTPSRRMLERVGITADLIIASLTSEADRRRLVNAVLGSIYRRFPYRIRYIDSAALIARFFRTVARRDAEFLGEEISIICPEAFSVVAPMTVGDYIVHEKAFRLWWD